MLACRSRARTGPRATQPGFPASRPVLVPWHSNLYLNGRRNAHSNTLFPSGSAPDTVRHRLQGLGQAAFVDLAAAADRLRRASLRRLRWPCGLIPGGKPPHPPRQGPRPAATPRTRQRTASSPRPRPSQPQSGIPTSGPARWHKNGPCSARTAGPLARTPGTPRPGRPADGPRMTRCTPMPAAARARHRPARSPRRTQITSPASCTSSMTSADGPENTVLTRHIRHI